MASLAAFPGRALASQEICCGVDYLEALGKPGTLKGTAKYLPPSQLHDAYDYAIYVNAAAKGPAAQKMWVLNRVGRKFKTEGETPLQMAKDDNVISYLRSQGAS